jgi:hypothetical protein
MLLKLNWYTFPPSSPTYTEDEGSRFLEHPHLYVTHVVSHARRCDLDINYISFFRTFYAFTCSMMAVGGQLLQSED